MIHRIVEMTDLLAQPESSFGNAAELFTHFVGSPLGLKSQGYLLEIIEQENVNESVENIDVHYGFLCRKIASVYQSFCTS